MSEKCKGKTASGEPCENYPVEGSEYCRFHNPKVLEAGEKAQQELQVELPSVKQVVRYLSKQGLYFENAEPIEAVDAYLSVYRDMGYKIIAAQAFDQNEVGIGMVYVLQKDA